MTLPILDLTEQYSALQDEIEAAALRVLRSGRYVLGEEVEALEAGLAHELNVAHVASCASGTDALILALRALRIGPGDEVLVPAFTFAASVEAVGLVGATPVFVDIDPQTLTLDLEHCKTMCTQRTRAVIAVHLFGLPVDIPALRDAMGEDVHIIEDCAQSIGATRDGHATGSQGDVGCFSFFPSKNLGACGDGGAVSTRYAELASRLRMLRNHGSQEIYRHETLGLNSRLDELQAAILRIKIPHLAQWNQQRKQVAAHYSQRLADYSNLQLPPAEPDGRVWHQYTFLSPQRDAIKQQLADDGIDSRIYYPIPLHQQKAYEQWASTAKLPVTEQVCAQCLSLPMFPELTIEQVERVCASIGRVAS